MNEVCKVKGGLDKFRIQKSAPSFYRLFVQRRDALRSKESLVVNRAEAATFKKLHITTFSAFKRYEWPMKVFVE